MNIMAARRGHFVSLSILVCLTYAIDSQAIDRNGRQIHFTQHPYPSSPSSPSVSQSSSSSSSSLLPSSTSSSSSSSLSSSSTDNDPLTRWLMMAKRNKPNVLLLIVDDLRPKLGCYGDTNMITPNIDQLASKSVRFDRAYSQQAVCGPSRTSFLTGRRPDTTRVVDLVTYWRTAGGNFTTLPQHFKEHGYVTQAVGKVFHPGVSSGQNGDFPYSWSAPVYQGQPKLEPETNNRDYHKSSLQPVDERVEGKQQDTDIADFSVSFLRNHTNSTQQPFFLAVGFRKPHLPFRYPKDYETLYPLSSIHLAPHNTLPPQMPPIAWSNYGELRKFEDIIALNVSQPYGPIPDHYQYKLRQGYSAAVSYVDAELGRVLAEMDHLELTQNTIIVFMGDHGWQLGENGEWSKHTNFEIAVRIPFTLYVPGVTSSNHRFQFINPLTTSSASVQAVNQLLNPGHSTEALVEAVDVFPTLSELAGIPVPPTCPRVSRDILVCSEGLSLVPVIRHVRQTGPSTSHTLRWKKAAFSQFHRNLLSASPVMGYTVRTAQHRYTEWVAFQPDTFAANFSRLYARELYVQASDPDEFHNVAEVASYRQTVEGLSQLLRRGWRGILQDYLALLTVSNN